MDYFEIKDLQRKEKNRLKEARKRSNRKDRELEQLKDEFRHGRKPDLAKKIELLAWAIMLKEDYNAKTGMSDVQEAPPDSSL